MLQYIYSYKLKPEISEWTQFNESYLENLSYKPVSCWRTERHLREYRQTCLILIMFGIIMALGILILILGIQAIE